MTKLLTSLLIAIALAAAWWLLARGSTVEPLLPPSPPPAATGDPDANAATAAPPPSEAAARSAATAPDRTPAAPAAATPQGLRGLVLDESSRPLPGVAVHLLESASNDPLALPMLLQQRVPASALASTETRVDGTFAIGLPRVQDRVYEIYLLSPAHATVHLGQLRLLPGEWHDLGAITMGAGATLRGRVTVAGLLVPVPNAVVTVEAGTAFDDVARKSLADGHLGLVATADGNGRYELRHAPARGAVRVAAVAPGFARVVRADVELVADQELELDFALPPGLALRGTVRDASGRAIPQARVEVWPNTSAAPPFLAASDPNGEFEVSGLTAGPHRVRASATGFQTAEVADAEAGRLDVAVVLAPRGRVRVRAIAPDGSVLRTYQLCVRRFFPDRGGQIGFVPDVPEQSVRLDGLTDQAEVAGLPAGTFVCEVRAHGLAKALSPPFQVQPVPAADAELVQVQVARGTTLRGRVLAADGSPLAGAVVATQADGADPENPAWKLLAAAVPDRITATRASTDANGEFSLPQLTAGSYQLEILHDAACRTVIGPQQIDGETDRTLPPIRMPRGTVVVGRATVGGRVAGQIKVVLMEAGAGRQGPTVRLETVTDAQGAFRLPRRVPPGTYDLRAAVVGTAAPDAQILQQLLQLQRSSTTVVIPAGLDVAQQDIDIPDAH